jgi:hypothetical protein
VVINNSRLYSWWNDWSVSRWLVGRYHWQVKALYKIQLLRVNKETLGIEMKMTLFQTLLTEVLHLRAVFTLTETQLKGL